MDPPRAARGQHQCWWGWYPSPLVNERAFTGCSEEVRWGGYCPPGLGIIVECCGKASWDYTRPHYEMFRGGTKGIEMKKSACFAEKQAWKQRDKRGQWHDLSDHALCPITAVLCSDQTPFLFYWVRDSIFWCCWHLHECRFFSLCCPVWVVVCTCTHTMQVCPCV